MIDYLPPEEPSDRSPALERAAPLLQRAGPILIVGKGAELPCRCIRCNLPGAGKAITQNLVTSKSSPHGVISTTIHFATRRATTLRYYLCESHRAARIRLLRISVLLALGGIAAFIAGMAWIRNTPVTPISFGLTLALTIGLLLAGFWVSQSAGVQPLAVQVIDDDNVSVIGAGPEFLDSIHPE